MFSFITNLFAKLASSTRVSIVKDRVNNLNNRCQTTLYGASISKDFGKLADARNCLERAIEIAGKGKKEKDDAKKLSNLLLEFGALQKLFISICDRRIKEEKLSEKEISEINNEKNVYESNLSDLEAIFKII